MSEFEFDWDPAKAASNLREHGVSFEDAGTILLDPLSRSIRDEDHSQFEERCITIGHTPDGRLLVVSHTEFETHGDKHLVRLISARQATPSERREYESGE